MLELEPEAALRGAARGSGDLERMAGGASEIAETVGEALGFRRLIGPDDREAVDLDCEHQARRTRLGDDELDAHQVANELKWCLRVVP